MRLAFACRAGTRYNEWLRRTTGTRYAPTTKAGVYGLDTYLRANRDWWDEAVPLHARSSMYDLASFKAGKSTLSPLELEELGDVSGKSLLHLQCHFGLDTLSLARLGARVTGVDFSAEAIGLARSLSEELGIPAEFTGANVYDLPEVLSGQFDIVYTSGGVLVWLPDLAPWGQIIAHFLKPGGMFYILEMHPFAAIMDDDAAAERLEVCYPYFHVPEPARFEGEGSYVDRDARFVHTVTYEWSHSLGDVINAITGAGLRIEFLHEFPFCFYQMLPLLTQDDAGWWRLEGGEDLVPLMFSLKATKD